MLVKIQKWGNSQGIRIPKVVLDSLGIKENDKVELTQDADSITIRKSKTSHRQNLEEYLTSYYGKPINQIELPRSEEYDWGKPVGEEIW